MTAGFPHEFAAPRDCNHHWEPVSMVMETQLLDEYGRVQVRQPDIHEGRVYFICRGCACHTYMTTQWLGVRMYGSEDAIDQERRGLGSDGYNRPAWALEDDGRADT
ncbi:hypothetical protein [Dietzia alimentaria]|uniref:hypothetical protein n=1 Tax=Dietzia alimentaria TaxID=665550 RepID=UPI00029A054F|nr:hypothetical protein [Dietzia alimentaria]